MKYARRLGDNFTTKRARSWKSSADENAGKPTVYRKVDYKTVRCLECLVDIGERCLSSVTGKTTHSFHASRKRLATRLDTSSREEEGTLALQSKVDNVYISEGGSPCSVCDGVYPLVKGGVIRSHAFNRGKVSRNHPRCLGSGEPPR